MNTAYFLFTEADQPLEIERFHICTWEFQNNTSLIEFGCEINSASVAGKNEITLELFIHWLKESFAVDDFYSKLSDSQNSRFIFNDSISGTSYLNGNSNQHGVIHQFSDRNTLAILPVTITTDYKKTRLLLNVNLNLYNNLQADPEKGLPNIYIRFSVTPQGHLLSTRKKGVAKSTILYDVKLNQRRNIPDSIYNEILQKELCTIKSCFCFHIIPNHYDLIFFDSGSLQNVRNLEYDSFKKYLNDRRIEKDELIVVFNKRKGLDSYAFFSIYTKEHIGATQITVALGINFLTGLLLFIPSYEASLSTTQKAQGVFQHLPGSFWIAIALMIVLITYLFWPSIFKVKSSKENNYL
jgi:hypothetical protein